MTLKKKCATLEDRIKRLQEIGLSLSTEDDINVIFELIMEEARNITNADGRTLYMISDDGKTMNFEILRNDSMNIIMGGTSGTDIPFPPMQLFDEDRNPNHSSIVTYSANTGKTVNIKDAYKEKGFDFSGAKNFDKSTGYRTKSVLSVPLKNHENDIVGVIQLINARDSKSGNTISFSGDMQQQVESLASQGAVALTNKRLVAELKNLFESANQDQFHSQTLAPLFDALNTPNREYDVFELTNTRVPYLNGGLFESDSESIRQMDFPASHFESLLTYFGEYNFTIDENDPNDHEVGIDPEMLGHIFENLLEDNKDKGAFYTPKPIVQYMCQESLIQYLKTHLIDSPLERDGRETDGVCKTIENFIRTFKKGNENDSDNYILQNAKKIEELLDNVKICDPAIGSGAFPMGLLQMIFRAKMSLDWTLDPAEVKRGIIQNSIYGVDIEKGAVDIARLRFWLSLIVDEKAPQPLPNLDYKIMQGNSLLESFEGVDLKFDHQRFQTNVYEPEVDIFGNPLESQVSITDYLTTSEGTAQFDIEKLEKEYFNTHDIEQKTKLKEKLDQFERSFITDCLNQKYIELENEITHLEKKITGITAKVKANKLTKLNKEIDHISDSRTKLENMASDEKPYFLWHLYFMDVFNKPALSGAEGGGFDIVIANPPYGVSIKGKLRDFVVNEIGKVPDYEIYYFFVNLSYLLLTKNGIQSYIIPNTILFNVFAKRYRLNFLKQWDIVELLDCTNFNIFEGSATVLNIISILRKSQTNLIVGYKQTKGKYSFLDLINQQKSWTSHDKVESKLSNML